MCYTASIAQGAKDTFEAFTGTRWTDPLPFPHFEQLNAMAKPLIPGILMGSNRSMVPLHWLLIPPNIRTKNQASSLKIWYANARIEELEQKPTYRNLVQTHRCILVFSAFYEWRHEGKKKVKHRVELVGSQPMLMPGLWAQSQLDGEIWNSCTLCTTTAQGIMRYIHNSALRMPVIVGPQGLDQWLDPDLSLEKARQEVLKDLQTSHLVSVPPVRDTMSGDPGIEQTPIQPELF